MQSAEGAGPLPEPSALPSWESPAGGGQGEGGRQQAKGGLAEGSTWVSEAPRLPLSIQRLPQCGRRQASLSRVQHILSCQVEVAFAPDKGCLAGRLPSTVPWLGTTACVSLQTHFTDGEAEVW